MKRLTVLLVVISALIAAHVSFADSIPSFSILDVTFKDVGEVTRGVESAYFFANISQCNPVWSPDGSKIAFTGYVGHGIWLVSAEGGEAELLYVNYHEYDYKGELYADCGQMKTLAFSADGSEIYFHDWTMDADSHIALGSDSAASTNPKIYALDIESGEARVLVERAHLDACFTRDSRYCVYNKLDEDSYRNWLGLYVMDLETGEDRYLGVGGNAHVNCLSPDETDVIYYRVSEGESQLYSVPFEGGVSEAITGFSESDVCYNPNWSNYSTDGEWLFFVGKYRDWWDESGYYANIDGSTRRVNYEGICCMNVDDGSIMQITPDTKYNIESSPRMSPDGSKLMYQAATYDSYYSLVSKIHIVEYKPVPFNVPTAVAETTPAAFALTGNFPNPFNPATTIEFSLDKAASVRLNIYNTAGQLVRELVDSELGAGHHSAVWDGLDQSGSNVSSGVYLYRLSGGGVSETKSMTLLR